MTRFCTQILPFASKGDSKYLPSNIFFCKQDDGDRFRGDQGDRYRGDQGDRHRGDQDRYRGDQGERYRGDHRDRGESSAAVGENQENQVIMN